MNDLKVKRCCTKSYTGLPSFLSLMQIRGMQKLDDENATLGKQFN